MLDESQRGVPDVDTMIRELLEGTAQHTGPHFFSALVKHLAAALGVAGAWVTELSADRRRLRAFSFWFQDHYIPEYEYALDGTPCEPVFQTCALFHVPDNVVELYPLDPDLAPLGAVSYLGLPLKDAEGKMLGHLAVLDVRPLELTTRVESVLRIFGARAAAEVERHRADQRTRERERQLSSILDSMWESILVVDAVDGIRDANRAAREKFELSVGDGRPIDFGSLLSEGARVRWRQHARMLREKRTAAGWIGDLELRTRGGELFPAEASLSAFDRDGVRYWTIIVRDLHEQRAAEKRMALLEAEARKLREELADAAPVGRLIGESAAMRTVFGQIRQVAPTDATVLIQGETGTGKELVARAIHEASARRGRAMVRVNCGAIAPALMESEFFGHEKGAFTGATERREGRFALADGGTLFLDEIGELPLELQVKLLRVLQEGEFEAVGSGRTRKVDVRIVAATNRDLAKEIERGRFRADLYYRLHVFPVRVPPLRERGDDLMLLAQSIVERLEVKLNRRFRPLSRAACEQLRRYNWPGNVRELENTLERAAILTRGEELQLDRGVPPAVEEGNSNAPSAVEEDAVLTASQWEALERRNMIRALRNCGWKVAGTSGAARLLGIAPSTFTSRMKALGITRSGEKPPDSLS